MTRRLQNVLAVLAALELATCAVLVVLRASYPFELEWQEGGVLEHVARAGSPSALYARPALEFIAFPYTPLYYFAGALATKVFGAGFFGLRLVSILSSIACCILIGRLAASRSKSRCAALFAAGLYAACFRFAGAWFDVARVDALFLALALAGILVIDARRGWKAAVLAAALFFLAFFTKQIALVIALPLCVPLWWRSRRDALVFAATLAALVVASTLVMNACSDHWYRWYVFDLLAGHPFAPDALFGFWREMLLGLGLVVLLALWTRGRGGWRREDPLRTWFYLCAVAGLWLASWISRAHVGGYDNTLMPACAGAAMTFGPALARALESGGRTALVAAAVGVLQLAMLVYDPRAQLPTRADREAGEQLVERLRTTPGEVWIPDHGFLARRAGKSSTAHGMAVIDLLQASDHDVAQGLVRELERALTQRRFAAIVLDRRWDEELPALAQNYDSVRLRYADERTFVPVTGDQRRPQYWYLPR